MVLVKVGDISSPENMAITIARAGVARAGSTRSGFIGDTDGTQDTSNRAVAGSTSGPHYAISDRNET